MKAIVGVDGGALFFGRGKDLRSLFSIRDSSGADTMVKIDAQMRSLSGNGSIRN
jgi:hypothetical protein